jgi:hypothetical protein
MNGIYFEPVCKNVADFIPYMAYRSCEVARDFLLECGSHEDEFLVVSDYMLVEFVLLYRGFPIFWAFNDPVQYIFRASWLSSADFRRPNMLKILYYRRCSIVDIRESIIYT